MGKGKRPYHHAPVQGQQDNNRVMTTNSPDSFVQNCPHALAPFFQECYTANGCLQLTSKGLRKQILTNEGFGDR